MATSHPLESLPRLLTRIPRKRDGTPLVGYYGIQKILEKETLNTIEKRRKMFQACQVQERVSRRFSPQEKISAIEKVILNNQSLLEVARELKVSRQCLYKWIKAYQSIAKTLQPSSELESAFFEGLSDQYPTGSSHWKWVGRKVKEKVVKVALANPRDALPQLMFKFPKKEDGSPLISYYSAQKVLEEAGLNTLEKRIEKARLLGILDKPPRLEGEISSPRPADIRPLVLPNAPPQGRFDRVLKLTSVSNLVLLFFLFIFCYFSLLLSFEGSKVGFFIASISLLFGFFFFLYSLKYYFTIASILLYRGSTIQEKRRTGLVSNLDTIQLPENSPFVSLHIASYNEKRVIDRILIACTSQEYENYEVVVADDSTDETVEILERWKNHPKVKIHHRETRAGFKGGALQEALRIMDPRTEFVIVLDADFIPYPDTIIQFLKYFTAAVGTYNQPLEYSQSQIAAIQGYQWHVLNKSENWITRGVRSEYAGSYVVERSGTEFLGSLKQIAGSVYMIRADVLKYFGWGTSITEDFQLTLRLYEKGYKVIYTPYIQAPAECVSTIKRLIRQRMRWAEGHSFNVKQMFKRLMKSSFLSFSEKMEFLYLSPYYLQAAFFIIGTLSWFVSEAVFHTSLPYWTSLWGWSLVFTNMFALPLMNSVGLFLEEAEEKDYAGFISFVMLSYLIAPFQAYAAVKGLLEKEEGTWFRTPKSGKVTDTFQKGRLLRLLTGFLPGRMGSKGQIAFSQERRIDPIRFSFVSAHNTFTSLRIKKRMSWLGTGMLVLCLTLTTLLLSLTPLIQEGLEVSAQTQFGAVDLFNVPEKQNLSDENTTLQMEETKTEEETSIAEILGQEGTKELTLHRVNETTYGMKSLDGSIIEVGTERNSPPQPYVKLHKWDGEASLKVEIPFFTTEIPEVVDKKLRYYGEGVGIDFYPKEPEKGKELDELGNEHPYVMNEEGGIEFDTILYKKPISNTIEFSIQTSNLDFYYQPPLNQEQHEEGINCTETTCWDKEGNITEFRPENIVGSYAVYHSEKRDHVIGKTNYKTGKAFQIYRPKIFDAVGNEIWGTLNINAETDLMTITIDQIWLESAVYPVVVDPTLGFTVAGGTELRNGDDNQYGIKITAPNNGTITKHTTYIDDRYWDAAVYDWNSSTGGDKVAEAGVYQAAGSSPGWVDLTFGTEVSITGATDYWLMVGADGGGGGYPKSIFYDSGSSGDGIENDNGGGFPPPGTDFSEDPMSATSQARKYSIYATYHELSGRIWSSGFELNSLTQGVEWDYVWHPSYMTLSAGAARSGSYGLDINVTSNTAEVEKILPSADVVYMRTFLKFPSSVPTSTYYLMVIYDPDYNRYWQVKINSSSQLELENNAYSTVATTSISAGDWHRLELKIDVSNPSSTSVEAKLDGATFATDSSDFSYRSNPYLKYARLGPTGTSTTGQVYLDDIAINSDVGSYQNSWPGDGKIVHLKPNAAGDASDWTNDYTYVDETTPDDATTLVASNTANQIDDHNIENSSTAGIASSDTISLVQVGARFNGA
ncbi:MAG TPA: glycosyltransferase, partial [Candidatus Nanoarchaeia archaeon]|nr:glycosyltransferase [Candidatus Nanoarchaeia archaeon]